MKYPQEEDQTNHQEYEPIDDMPEIPPGEEGEIGDTLDDVTSIEEELKSSTWLEEAQQIPLDKVTPKEREVLTKFLNGAKLDFIEEDYLEQVLAQYRPAIQKHKPQETLENIEHNLEYNKAEKSFLEILQQQKQEKTLTVNYPLDDGSTYTLELIIKRTNAQTITDLQTNFKLFQDLTPREDNVRLKQQQGQPLTREEQLILENINQKINEKVMANQEEMMVEFLATHTRIQDEAHNPDYMRKIYRSMDPTILTQIFTRVSQLSGLTNPAMDELFQ